MVVRRQVKEEKAHFHFPSVAQKRRMLNNCSQMKENDTSGSDSVLSLITIFLSFLFLPAPKDHYWAD